MMDNGELQTLVESISEQWFGKAFTHKAIFNPRLRTTGGRYLLSSHNIEVNKKYYEEYGLDELIGIIKHELCHYHLHLEGKGYHHRDKDFKELMNKVKAPRFCSTLTTVQKRRAKKQYLYQCQSCGQLFKRMRRVDTKKYVCGKCKGKLVLIESVRSRN